MQNISKFIITLSLFALSTKMCAQSIVANAIGCNGVLYTIYSDGTWKAGTTAVTSTDDDDAYYSGSASVSVENKEGRKRVVSTLLPCHYYSSKGKSSVKQKLRHDLEQALKADEVMTAPIVYDLERCK